MKNLSILIHLFFLTTIVHAQETKHTWEQIQIRNRNTILEATDPSQTTIFPNFKIIPTAKWSHSSEDRQIAYQALRDSGGELLLEVIINVDGKVVKSRDIRNKGLDKTVIKSFEVALKSYQFSHANILDGNFRTFYVIMDVQGAVDIHSQTRHNLE